VKRWRSAFMALRWTAAAMQEAVKGFRRLKAHKQLPALRAALEARQTNRPAASLLAKPTPLNINFGSDRFAMSNKQRDISFCYSPTTFPVFGLTKCSRWQARHVTD
jgi:hypothetical protein